MKLSVTKDVKVVPILSADDVVPGMDVYTSRGTPGTITYVALNEFDVYFPTRDRTIRFKDDGVNNIFWGIFREVPDWEKVTNNAVHATEVRIPVTSLDEFTVGDEIEISGEVYGKVTKATAEKVTIKATLPNGASGIVYLDSEVEPEFLEQFKILKLH